jgi:hypothetical protein
MNSSRNIRDSYSSNRNINGESGFLSTPDTNEYLIKVSKGIPSEIVAVYLMLFAFLNCQTIEQNKQPIFYWILFALCLLLTPMYLYKFYGVDDKKQLLLSTICFVIWSMALGGPFDFIISNSKFIGAFFTPIISLVIPLFIPKGDKSENSDKSSNQTKECK